MDPATTIVALQKLLSDLVSSVTDRKFAAELREIQQLVSGLASANFALQQENLQIQTNNAKLQETISRLQNRVAELEKEKADQGEEVFHKGVLFRRNSKTRGKWLPFCPKCQSIVNEIKLASGDKWANCGSSCGWNGIPLSSGLDLLISEMAG